MLYNGMVSTVREEAVCGQSMLGAREGTIAMRGG